MKKFLYIFSLSFLGFAISATAQEDFRKNAPKGGPAPKIELGESTTFKLDNGLTVIVVENNRLPRVNFQLTVDVPSLVEGDKAGTASIAGQLLRTGTQKKSKADIDEAVDFIGATLNAGGGGMFASSLTKHTETLLSLMQEVLLMPSFPQEEFDKIKDQTKSGLATAKDDPSAISSRVSNVVRYGVDHPYGEFQSEASTDNISLDDCKAYYNTYFKPNISYLVIVGDITQKKAKSLANKYFGDWKKGDIQKPSFNNPSLPAKRSVAFVDKPGAVQSVINVTYPIDLKPNAKDRMAARILNSILGGGSRGRLFRNLREDKGYTYGSYSSLSSDREIGEFSASASVRNAVTDSSVVEILKEMERLRTEKVSEDILQETKNRISGGFARGTESPQTIASYALNIIRYDLKDDHYATYLERLQAVTSDDIMKAANKYLHPDNAQIVIVGSQEEVVGKLDQFGDVNILDIYGAPKAAPKSAGDATVESVINNYIDAIGGEDRLTAVKDITIMYEAEAMGQKVSITQMKKGPAKMAMQVSVMGNVMQEIKYDGKVGSQSAMGQTQKIEGEQADGMRLDAAIFPELQYLSGDYDLKLLGLELVGEGNDKQEAYAISMKDAAGNSRTDYYSKEFGFKIRTVATADANGQTITVTNEYKNYDEVSGIKFPHLITVSGMMPIPLSQKVVDIKVNTGLEDAAFEVK